MCLTLILLITFAAGARADVSGIVFDLEEETPVPRARVTMQGSGVAVTTSDDGRFTVAAPPDEWVTIVAARKGYYNEARVVRSPTVDLWIELEEVPAMDNPNYTPLEPKECGECHPDQLEQWTDSPMAGSGVNTWVHDIFSGDGTENGAGGFVYTRDSAYADTNPESECAACHQPESWIAAPHSAMAQASSQTEGGVHGVTCEVCHKIADIDESRKNFPGIYPGVVTWSRPEQKSHQVQYGALGDGAYASYPFRMRASYQPQFTAAMCGACHQDKNDPDEDGDFEEENGGVSEPTYLEWLHSPYGDPTSPHFATCVDCHMPSYGATVFCDFQDFTPTARAPDAIRHHRIEGTTPRYLENAVSLELSAEIKADVLEVQVAVINDKTGHHVPDGVTIRNMILLVEARQPDSGAILEHIGSQTVHELGGVGDPVQGYYAGLPGKLFAKVSHDAKGTGPVFFTEATCVLWDSRIAALAEDVSSYDFRIPPDAGELRVGARLIFRRAFRALVDQKGWTEDGHGRSLADIAPPHFGHLMEEAEWSSEDGTLAGEERLPNRSVLYQNFPNPLNPATTIGFDLRRTSSATLRIYDLLGQEVMTLVEEQLNSGYQTVEWDGRGESGQDLSSGVYLYSLEVGTETHTRKLLLLR